MTDFDETHNVPPGTAGEDGVKPLAFIKNDAGGVQQGYWEDVFPTMRTDITPAVARRECFGITPCDANGTRADRPDGGLYVTRTETSKTLTRGNPNTETVVVEPPAISLDGDKMGKAERDGGSGLGVNTEDVMYTQTAKDVHAVAYGGRHSGADLCNGRQTGDVAATLAANSCATAARNGPSVLDVDAAAVGRNESHASAHGKDECVPIDMRNAARDAGKRGGTNRQGAGVGEDGSPAPTVTANPPGVGWRATVRRLLPVETERLMGFPDNWTMIPWKGRKAEECPDAPRYKACGNSMCVNVMRWIGLRIEAEERRIREELGNGRGEDGSRPGAGDTEERVGAEVGAVGRPEGGAAPAVGHGDGGPLPGLEEGGEVPRRRDTVQEDGPLGGVGCSRG